MQPDVQESSKQLQSQFVRQHLWTFLLDNWITRPFQCIPTLKTSTNVVMAGHGCFGSGAKTTCAASTRADRQKPMELKDRAFPAGLAKGSVMGHL
jgi:hypothetical protein